MKNMFIIAISVICLMSSFVYGCDRTSRSTIVYSHSPGIRHIGYNPITHTAYPRYTGKLIYVAPRVYCPPVYHPPVYRSPVIIRPPVHVERPSIHRSPVMTRPNTQHHQESSRPRFSGRR